MKIKYIDKLFLIGVVFLCIGASSMVQAETLVDGTSFDSWTALESEWNYYYPWGQTHNGSAKMYIDQLSLYGGVLTITAETPDPESDYKYRSGAIHLKESIDISENYPEWSFYGEFRAPYLTGTWPAFWITRAGSWTHECDILEYKGDKYNWFNTYDGGWETTKVFVDTCLSEWHSYELHAYKKNATDVTTEYYLDGVLKGTHTLSGGMGISFWLIINLQMEGSSGSPGPTEPTYYYARNVIVTRTVAPVPPPAPTNLSGTPGDAMVDLHWSSSAGADTYNVYRSTTRGGPYDTIATGLTTNYYTDTSVVNDTTYYYVISAVNEYGESPDSLENNYTPCLTPVSQGKAATASSFESGNDPYKGNDGNFSSRWTASDSSYPQWWKVDLGSVQSINKACIYWYNSATRSYKYKIETSNDDSTYTTIVDKTGTTETENTVDSFSASARYVRVTVTGVTPSGGWAAFFECQIFSGEPDTTPPAAPTGLVATAGDSWVSLNWNDNTEPDLASYNVYRGTTTGGPYAQIATDVTVSAYTDNSVTNGTTYYYVVTAVDTSNNESDNSNEVSATPEAGSGAIDVANSDILVAGSVGGSYVDTQDSDNIYESITEIESGGRPESRYSYLEHKWTINVTGGTGVTFCVEAYQTASSDGDNFVFAYSTDDSTYTNMLTVTKTSDDNTYQSYSLPASLSGTVYIRVTDTDRTSGNRNLDAIYVDHMYILSSGGEPDTTPPAAPTGLTATAGNSTVGLNWNDNTEPDLASYSVYRSTTSGSGYSAIATGVGSSAYTDNSVTNGTTYYYVVTAVDTSSNESSYSNEASATPQAGVETDMYVSDIAMSYKAAGPNYSGLATVTIRDETAGYVDGATVYGDWSGATTQSVSGTTGADGTVTFESSKVRNGGTFTFCVTDVVKSGYIYNSSLNVETCDSITAP
ncbi:MAG: discoidin domain-containing protein [Sedimentisphaerales bacterium]|nr:discoidin domain-containing protein [Sedimentisphaerales bacterium]